MPTMSAGCCAPWVGRPNVPSAALASGTRLRFSTGLRWTGPASKKSRPAEGQPGISGREWAADVAAFATHLESLRAAAGAGAAHTASSESLGDRRSEEHTSELQS